MTSTSTPEQTAHHDPIGRLSASFDLLFDANEAFIAAVTASSISDPTRRALDIIRDSVDLLQQLMLEIAKGSALDAPEVANLYRWSIMKITEANEAMPEAVRGELPGDCFRRGRGAPVVA